MGNFRQDFDLGRRACRERGKFTEEQIAFALKQAEVGTPIEEVCQKMGISDATNSRAEVRLSAESAIRRSRRFRPLTGIGTGATATAQYPSRIFVLIAPISRRRPSGYEADLVYCHN
jgi:transposase